MGADHTNVVVPAVEDIARIQSRVRSIIASLTADELAVDVTAIEATQNLISKGIMQHQVGEIVLLHLVDAVLGGVELGLRDIVRSHGSSKTRRDSSPSASSKPTSPDKDPRVRAPPPALPREHPAYTPRTSPRTADGLIPTPQDTPDI